MFLYKYLSVIAIFIFRFCNSSVCMFCLASSRLPFILPANRHCHRYSDAQCVQCVHCEFHNSLSLFCPGLLCSVCRFAGERVQIALNSKHQTEAPEGRHGSLSLGAMTLVQSLTRTTFSTLPDVLGGNRIRFTTSAESLPSHRASLPSYLPFIMKNAEKCSQQSEKFDIILVSVCVCESAGDFHLALPIDSLHFPLFHHIYIGWGLNTLYNPADDIWSNCSNAVSNQPPRFFSLAIRWFRMSVGVSVANISLSSLNIFGICRFKSLLNIIVSSIPNIFHSTTTKKSAQIRLYLDR